MTNLIDIEMIIIILLKHDQIKNFLKNTIYQNRSKEQMSNITFKEINA